MPSSSPRSATRSTTVWVSCTSSETRSSGCRCVELAEEHRHDDRGRAGRGADRELARERAGALGGDLVEHLLLELEQALGAAEQPQPGLGRLDPAAGAVEQLRAEPLLERPHLQRDGGLRDAEPLRRLREAPPFDDGAERGELARIHKRILSQDRVRRDPALQTPARRASTIRSAHEGLDRHDELAARAVLPAADRAARGARPRGPGLGARLRADARAARRGRRSRTTSSARPTAAPGAPGKIRAMGSRLRALRAWAQAAAVRPRPLARLARASARRPLARGAVGVRVRLRVRARPAHARLARRDPGRRSRRDPAGAARPARRDRRARCAATRG